MTQNTDRLSEADLAQFTGSENLYRHGLARSVLSPMARNSWPKKLALTGFWTK